MVLRLPVLSRTLLRDADQALLAAAGVLPGNEPDPGGEVPTRPERGPPPPSPGPGDWSLTLRG
jgi:hypothetical protein